MIVPNHNSFPIINHTKSINGSEEVCPSETSTSTLFLGHDVGGIILISVACIGVVANFFGMSLTFRIKLRTLLYNQVLSALLIVNTIFLCCTISIGAENLVSPYLNVYVWAYFILPTKHICFLLSTYLMTALAHDRYCATVSFPSYHNRTVCPGDRLTQLLKYIMPSLAIAMVIAIPTFFEYQIMEDRKGNLVISPSDMRVNEYYILFYVVLVNNVLLGIVPCLVSAYYFYQTLIFRTERELAAPLLVETHRRIHHRRAHVWSFLRMPIFGYVLLCMPYFAVKIIETQFFVAVKPVNMVDHLFCYPTWFHVVKVVTEVLVVLNCSVNAMKYLY